MKVSCLGASPRSAGKKYSEAVSWKLSTPCPSYVADLKVLPCSDPQLFKSCKIIFSGLDSDVAGDIELAFLKADLFGIFSNAKNHRMNPIVPLCVPLVNTEHMDMIPHQRKAYNLTKGFLVTNANCSTTGLVVALKALQVKFGYIDKMFVTTLQAISGAGYPGKI